MKIRNGFVSNSSSSSFVLFGIRVNGAKLEEVYGEDFYDLAEEDGFSVVSDEGRGGYLIGEYFNAGEDIVEIDLQSVKINKLENKLKEKGFEFDKFKLFAGTYYS